MMIAADLLHNWHISSMTYHRFFATVMAGHYNSSAMATFLL